MDAKYLKGVPLNGCKGCDLIIMGYGYCRRCREERIALQNEPRPSSWAFIAVLIGANLVLLGLIMRVFTR